MASNGGSYDPPEALRVPSREESCFMFPDHDSSRARVEALLKFHRKATQNGTEGELSGIEAAADGAAVATAAAAAEPPSAAAVVALTSLPSAAGEIKPQQSDSQGSQNLAVVAEAPRIEGKIVASDATFVPTQLTLNSEQTLSDQYGRNSISATTAPIIVNAEENVKPKPTRPYNRANMGRPSTLDPNNKYDKHYIRPPIHRRKQIEAARLAREGIAPETPLTNGTTPNGTNHIIPNGTVPNDKLTPHIVNGLGRPALKSVQPPYQKTVPRVPQEHHPPTQNGKAYMPSMPKSNGYKSVPTPIVMTPERLADRARFLAREAARKKREADMALTKKMEDEKKKEEAEYKKMVEERKEKMLQRMKHKEPMIRLTYANEDFIIPTVLTQHEQLLKDVLCASVYAQLPHELRDHLKKFLPPYEEYNVDDEVDVLDKAFSRNRDNIHGKPVKRLFNRLNGGLHMADKISEKKKTLDNNKLIYEHRIRFQGVDMMGRLLKNRNMMVESGKKPDDELKKLLEKEDRKEMARNRILMDRVKRRTKLIFSDIRQQVGDTKTISSDEEDVPLCNLNKNLMTSRTRSTMFSLEHCRDLDLHQAIRFDDVPTMLKKHRHMKKARPNSRHPVYNTKGIKLDDVYLRAGVLPQAQKIKAAIIALEKDVPKRRGFPEIKRLPLD